MVPFAVELMATSHVAATTLAPVNNVVARIPRPGPARQILHLWPGPARPGRKIKLARPGPARKQFENVWPGPARPHS